MKKSYIVIGVIVVLVLIAFFTGKSAYNNMTTLEQEVEEVWGKVQVQYQRRMDLIPNMVETVKGYAAHESKTYENVTRARAGLSDAYNDARANDNVDPANEQSFNNFAASQEKLNKALSIYVNAVREAYPDLKADTQFTNLQTVLEGTENRIATERTRYTEIVTNYNVTVRRFPANIFAGIFGFSPKPQFKADAEAAHAPQVQF